MASGQVGYWVADKPLLPFDLQHEGIVGEHLLNEQWNLSVA